jgi:hypothetical protein
MSERFDPYLGSGIKRDDAINFLWEYALGKAGLSPKAPRSDVPNPTTPYRGTSGNYVGTDTSKVGGNNRNIDLEALDPNVNSPYVDVNPDEQKVITGTDGELYVIDKDQKIVGKTVLPKDAPTGVGRWWAGSRDWLDKVTGQPDIDRDQRGNWGTKDDQLLVDTETTRAKSPVEKQLDQVKTTQAIDKINKSSYDAKQEEALNQAMKTAEHQAAVDLNYMKQLYPVAQAAAWDATQRGLYGDKYSASAAQRRAAEAAGAEAVMYAAVANQANAAANMRGRYTGKNISFG